MKIKDIYGKVLFEIKGNTLVGKDLSNKMLDYANFTKQNLEGIDFSNSSLIGADLSNSYLAWSNFEKAILKNCYLRNSCCDRATFDCANMTKVDLSEASMVQASLYYTCLRDANASDVNFAKANLGRADVFHMIAKGAHFGGTNFKNTINRYELIIDEYTSFIGENDFPEESFIAWTKVYVGKLKEPAIAKLLIPEDAKCVSSSNSAKCRCSKVKVLEIQSLSGYTLKASEGIDRRNILYKVGEFSSVEEFNIWAYNQDGEGIYFYNSRYRAVKS